MAKLLQGRYTYTSSTNVQKPHFKVRIEDEDTIANICEVLHITEKQFKKAYYKPVNEEGPKGCKNGSSGPTDLISGKNFYYPFDKCIKQKLNVTVVHSTTTSIRCMYGPEEPMRYRYILFWELNGQDGNAKDFRFKSNDHHNKYGRKNSLLPVGLGVTDGDGILCSESLRWISDVQNNKSIKLNESKIPQMFKERDICIKFEENMGYGVNPLKRNIHLGKEFKHDSYIRKHQLYTIENDNWIFKDNLSKFFNNVKYAFMPLPVDYFNGETFESIPLFDLHDDFVKEFIPRELPVDPNLNNRKLYCINNVKVDETLTPIRQATAEGRANYLKEPQYKTYQTASSFENLNVNSPDVNYYKLITEKVPRRKEVTLKCTLPDWIARIKQCIRDTKFHYRTYKDITRKYSDAISIMEHVGNISSIVSKFPSKKIYYHEVIAPVVFAEKAYELQQDLLDKLKNLNDPEYVEAKDKFIVQAEKLYNLINDKEFAQEISDYLNLNIKVKGAESIKREPVQLELNDKEKFYLNIANELCYVLNKSFTLIKNTDFFNFEAEKANSQTIAMKAYRTYHDIVSNVSGGKTNDQNALGVVLDQIGKEADESFIKEAKEIVGRYFINAPGTPSLLVCLTDVFGPYIAQNSINNQNLNNGIHKLSGKFLKLMIDNRFDTEFKSKILKFISNRFEKNWKQGFSEFIFTDENNKKFPNLINKYFKSFMFGANLITLLTDLEDVKLKGRKRITTIVKDILTVRLGAVGLFMKGGLLKDFTIARIGIAISFITIFDTSMDLMIACKSGRLKKERLLTVELVFAIIGLVFFFGIGGFIPSILFMVAEFGIRGFAVEMIMGGPVEQEIFKICSGLESRDSFLTIKNDESLNDKYTILMNILNKFTRTRSRLSWRAIIPLMEIGMVVHKKKLPQKDNYKIYEEVIDYEKTEELIDEIVDAYEPGFLQKMMRPENEINDTFGYSFDGVFKKYRELLEAIDKLERKDIMSGTLINEYPLKDFNLLKTGDYTNYSPGGRTVDLNHYSLNVLNSKNSVVILKANQKKLDIYDINELIY